MSGSSRRIKVAYDKGAGIITITLPFAQREFPDVWRFAVEPNIVDVRVIREKKMTGFELTLNAKHRRQCYTQLSRILPRSIISSILDGPQTNRTIFSSGQALSVAAGALRQIAKFSNVRTQYPAQPPASILPDALTPDVVRRRQTQYILTGLVDETTGLIPAHRFPGPRPAKLVVTSDTQAVA